MPAFVKLKDPATYVSSPWDLSTDADGRAYWVPLFIRHFDLILSMGIEVATARGESPAAATARADACRAEYRAHFTAFDRDPAAHPGPVTILTLDRWRDGFLRKHGFVDPFIDLKNRENARMLPLLPAVCRQLDAIADDREQIRAVVEGVFAGNIFDMGSEATARLFVGASPDFFAVRAKLKPRPWLFDDLDRLTGKLLAARYRKAVFFVDNAGSDFLLGALPMMRWLARRGTAVILAANERPTLNDMTVHDVRAWWDRILDTEPSLRGLPITPTSTGTGEPLIDLADVSPELNAAARDADLVILEGMGRGVESNLRAEFNCDALNIAMLKDEGVAKHVGGAMYDCVCRFR